jgi:hypothetical protein
MNMHPPLDHELNTYSHVFFTSDETWNPAIMDQEYDIEDIIITENDHIPSFGQEELSNYGELNSRECSMHLTSNQHHLEESLITTSPCQPCHTQSA